MVGPGIENATLKKLGGFTQKQIIGVAIAFVLAFVLTVLGASAICLGPLIIAVVLCMIPRMLGVDRLKFMVPFGMVFMVVTILVGAFAIAPMSINDHDPADDDQFKNVTFECSEGEVRISAVLEHPDEIGVHEVYFYYGKILRIDFVGTLGNIDEKVLLPYAADGSIDVTIALDADNFYSGYLGITKTDDDGNEVNDAAKPGTDLRGAYAGSITSLTLYGCFYTVVFIMVLFYAILLFSAWTRKRFEQTRERLEKEGRLYPQGYGRCDKCGNIVLPGEINCRKCGAYIDRPEELKPDKKDFFECSDCGAEVP
ncbi:MAG: ABC transporter permease, partial [Candidatus Methanoplasma sp.]|nr:ABC transporter permease [Candidatus Methanoplasma sp.]